MIFLVLLASFSFFSAKRLLTYLHIFQQDEYDNSRFLKWVLKHRAFDKRLTILLCCTLLINQLIVLHSNLITFLIALLFTIFAFNESDPRRIAKKKLVLTSRAQRIFLIAFVFAVMMGCIYYFIPAPWWWIVSVQSLPLLLAFANEFLRPVEKLIQQKYWDDACKKVRELQPFIIGITGSFGKTSVKHILGHILEVTSRVLITPGSVNTPMGISRTIRERLKPYHKFFVVEMGAYGPGSITRLCKLTPPNMAIITGIGYAHYERFKSIETVAKAKFELAEAVCKIGGKIVTNDEVLAFPYTRAFADTNKDNFILIDDKNATISIKNIQQQREGLIIDIIRNGEMFVLEVPLYGKHHAKNVALAFAAACEMGIPPATVAAALKSTPQIPHRLQLQQQVNGAVVIDDAYNSNPEGFLAALELLDILGQSSGRRILVTPGMVELGKVHDMEHARIGCEAVRHTDIVLAIAPEQIKSFVDAFRANMQPHQELIPCPTFAVAQCWLTQHTGDKDVILIENDLPDLYEASLNL